jgi:hypothetical protein
MPRFPRAEIPAGFALRELPGHRWQAYRLNDPKQESPTFSRRLQAINWCLLQLGQEAAKKSATK